MKKTTLFYILGGCLLLALAPIIIYMINFGFRGFSNDDSDWIGFGNYIGGTVGPIVSLLSLLILGWITFMVARNSNQESFKQQVLLKRTEAYQQLTTHIVRFNLLKRRLNVHIQHLKTLNEHKNKSQLTDLVSSLSTIQENFTSVHEFCQFIFNFNMSYGYLYKYDFEGDEFKRLLQSTEELKKYAIEMESSIINSEGRESDFDPDKFMDNIVDFINSLLKEMDLDPYL